MFRVNECTAKPIPTWCFESMNVRLNPFLHVSLDSRFLSVSGLNLVWRFDFISYITLFDQVRADLVTSLSTTSFSILRPARIHLKSIKQMRNVIIIIQNCSFKIHKKHKKCTIARRISSPPDIVRKAAAVYNEFHRCPVFGGDDHWASYHGTRMTVHGERLERPHMTKIVWRFSRSTRNLSHQMNHKGLVRIHLEALSGSSSEVK